MQEKLHICVEAKELPQAEFLLLYQMITGMERLYTRCIVSFTKI